MSTLHRLAQPFRLVIAAARATACALLIIAATGAMAPLSAQTDIEAHYADGQVWITWTVDPVPLPATYEIYGADGPILDLSDAEPIGRLFAYEYFPGALREQLPDPSAGWVIPAAVGAGVDTLPADRALFVETVHAAGQRYYAVVEEDSTVVNLGVNVTTTPVTTLFGPSEPVVCHLQHSFVGGGYRTRIYSMWADGRDDDNARPDFPVCANAAKNGMPSLFIASARSDLGTGPHPVTYWLHGGAGRAKQSLPNSRAYINIEPADGLLVAHNDDLVRYVTETQGTAGAIIEEPSNSWWFGWPADLDPFDPLAPNPEPGALVVNYTQRRLLWIHAWLIATGLVDPDRASLQGHSMGAAGATALAKANPSSFATATLFNNGFGGPGDTASALNLFGAEADAVVSNLLGADGAPVLVHDLFDLETRLSNERDLPLLRSWHGKNDDNGVMEWDAFVVEQYERADALGYGMHLYWDERQHGLPSPPPVHWAEGTTPATQTERDNAAYQHRYRASQSFPAFYNHSIQPGAMDPGDGTPTDGDDWGTWGGYHDWDLDTIVDTPFEWSAVIWLTGGSAWLPDNCADASLTSDLTVRRPQAFKPLQGTLIDWTRTAANGDTLQSGVVTVDADGLVRIVGVTTQRDPFRSRITLRVQPTAAVSDPGSSPAALSGAVRVVPNPFNPHTTIEFELGRAAHVTLDIHDVLGRRVTRLTDGRLRPGKHALPWQGVGGGGQRVTSGIYYYTLQVDGEQRAGKMQLLK